MGGDGRLTVDRLRDPVQIVRMDGIRLGADAEPVREPHRHDYHELLWLRSGHGEHVLDGHPLAVRPRSLTLIGRGQVHVFRRAEDVSGAAVRFGDEALIGGAAQRATPGWTLAGRGGLTVEVPAGEAPRLEAVIAALEDETRRPPDARSAELERHLLSVLLLWAERWYEATRTERRDADDSELQLHRRVVTDRVVLEAARLLRFADLTVQEVGHRTGFRDPLYFSRAFKRHRGEAPQAYRGRVQEKSMHR